MKNTGLLIFLTLFFSVAFSQYETPGTGVIWGLTDLIANSSGAVTSQDGIYYFNDDVIIAQTDTFQILSDEVIKIDQGKLMTIAGVLRATPPEEIIFTAIDSSLNFLGFRFEESSASIITRCTIEFGGGIKLIDTDMIIEECIIRKNGIQNATGAVNLFHSSPIISGSEFYLNEGPAIMSGADSESSPNVVSNYIFQNNTLNQNMPQINLGTSNTGDSIRIVNNEIIGNYDNVGGVAVSTLAGGNLKCIIRGNNIEGNRYGIAVIGNNISSMIYENTILNNNIQGNPILGGSGINFNGNESNVSFVSKNIISGNLWGITILGTALPNFGEILPDTVNIGKNQIFENGNEGQIYALYNNTPNFIFAENNYWGSYNLDTVEMYIFHQPDDAELGIVDYLPINDYLTSSPEIKNNDRISFSVYPNPADEMINLVQNLEMNEVREVIIINSLGNIQKRISVNHKKSTLNVSSLPKGVYFVGIRNGSKTAFRKFIKN